MQILLNALFSSTSGLVLAIIGWAFNMNGRVTAVETRVEGQPQKDAELRQFIKDLMDAKFDGLDTRLARIENNGNGHGKGN